MIVVFLIILCDELCQMPFLNLKIHLQQFCQLSRAFDTFSTRVINDCMTGVWNVVSESKLMAVKQFCFHHDH